MFKRIATKARNFFYGFLFKKFGERSNIFGRIVVYSPQNIELGDFSSLNEGVILNARSAITIGDCVHISSYCVLNTCGLDYEKIMSDRRHFSKPIIVENGVWLGSGVIVNPGVKIGKNSVIGAGAVVCGDIPEDAVAVGVPAKIIKKINHVKS